MFDLYLQIRARVDTIVSQVLRQDSDDWRLKHACAACTYKLMDEPDLKFKLLFAMDGNDSLKHILRRLPEDIEDATCPLVSRELPTGQVFTSSRYLPCEHVDQFAKAGSIDPLLSEVSVFLYILAVIVTFHQGLRCQSLCRMLEEYG